MSRKQFLVTTLLSSFTMAFLMSGLMSGINLGFNAAWPAIWMKGFVLAWPSALLLNLTILPQVRKLSAWIINPNVVSKA
ncbi:DUF2798 domain-containing protein [Vibrio hepatarius]|uniref:DUF2798 domain-containing protein n=1 Tax=Vibrio hepatarius TaxID=171383 RepID=UPI00142D9BA0|nr:DUF2798 domain-containing protein [Vibrio hepatarius]NIY84127.1 DUF2798 domain-containing protein [Vibrio hepatarius]